MPETKTRTIFDAFLEEMETVSQAHAQILEKVFEPKKDTDIVLLESVPQDVRNIVALAGAYRLRGEKAKLAMQFDPDADQDALCGEISQCEAKEKMLTNAWWTSIKDLANAWGVKSSVQIRVGWMVVEDPTVPTKSGLSSLAKILTEVLLGPKE